MIDIIFELVFKWKLHQYGAICWDKFQWKIKMPCLSFVNDKIYNTPSSNSKVQEDSD